MILWKIPVCFICRREFFNQAFVREHPYLTLPSLKPPKSEVVIASVRVLSSILFRIVRTSHQRHRQAIQLIFIFIPVKNSLNSFIFCLRRVLRGQRSLLVCPRLTGLRVAPPAPRRHVHPSPSAGNPLWRQSDANRRPELHALINCNAQVEQANSLVFS